jgi:hypothetical protein
VVVGGKVSLKEGSLRPETCYASKSYQEDSVEERVF